MMRRPEKTPPLDRWETDEYIIELHRQTLGWVVWTFQKFGEYKDRVWQYAAYEDRNLAMVDLLENYLPVPEPCRPETIEEIPTCLNRKCGMALIVVPSGGCGNSLKLDGWSCPVLSEWPHGIDQDALPITARMIEFTADPLGDL